MGWHAHLAVDYALEDGRTVARHRHDGPLRLLQSLYPEGQGICHNVLIHPPGGLVGGDVLDIQVTVGEGAHALLTTPGATRFYRCEGGVQATQQVQLQLAAGARLEWLPLETLVYPGAQAHNLLRFSLAPGAALLGWDVLALGLPHADQPFAEGCLTQRMEWPGLWLESARIDARDTRLLSSPLGLDGQRSVATMFHASGSPMPRALIEQVLDATREVLAAHPLADRAGVSAVNAQLLVLRVLADQTEPASALLRQVWALWRGLLWGAQATPPRLWAL